MLTACNEDVQRYLERPKKEEKEKIIKEIKEKALSEGINFNNMFKSNTKQYQVLDTIIYLLSSSGICKISSTKLAEKAGVSKRTVYNAVSSIKKLGSIIVAGLSDGKNKYIFLYKNHPDFNEILKNVFYLNADQIAEQFAEQENAKPIAAEGIKEEKSDSIHNTSFNKHEKYILRESIESDLSNNLQNEKHKAKTYLHNPYQKQLYTTLKFDSALHERIKDKSLIIALRAGSNLNQDLFSIAMKSIRKIDKHLYLGGSVESVPALFEKIYHDRIQYNQYYKKKSQQSEATSKRDTSFYYNWLKEG